MDILRKSWEIFRFKGIPVEISAMFLIFWGIIALISGDPIKMILFSALLCVSIIPHEFGHALVAKHYGFKVIKITMTPIGGAALIDFRGIKPIEEFWMTLAGPAMSIIMSVIFKILGSFGDINIFNLFCGLNLIWAVFNLIPIFPLDGGRIMRSGLQIISRNKINKKRATKIAVTCTYILGSVIAIYAISAGQIILFIIMIMCLLEARKEIIFNNYQTC
jgi:Zn-dependent protease